MVNPESSLLVYPVQPAFAEHLLFVGLHAEQPRDPTFSTLGKVLLP